MMQIGHSSYVPKHCSYYDFKTSIDEDFSNADLVVTSGGIGTLFELLNMQKRIVAVNNTSIPDQHQNEILERIAADGLLYHCKQLPNLEIIIQQALQSPPGRYQPPACSIESQIVDFMQEPQKIKRIPFFTYSKS
jgi:UDP-N-acetylglucosamine transferase subunit ALG13